MVARRWCSTRGIRGSAILEGVVVVPALALVVFGSIQLMMIAWNMAEVQFLTAEATRLVAIPNGGSYNCAAVQARASQLARARRYQSCRGASSDVFVTYQEIPKSGSPSAATASCPSAPSTSEDRKIVVVASCFRDTLAISKLRPSLDYNGSAAVVLEKPTR